jgi:hypothetical protein
VLELHAGDMYLHPKSTPFPSRSEGSIGLVIERKEQDKAILTVYCGIESCNHKLHEVYFELNDIEKTLFLILNTFKSLALRTVKNVEQLWKQIHDLSLKSIKCKVFFNYPISSLLYPCLYAVPRN